MPPLVYLTLSYVFGVLAQKIFDFNFPILLFPIVLLFLLSLLFFRGKKFLLLLLLLIFFCGMASLALRDCNKPENENSIVVGIRDKFTVVPEKILPKPFSSLLGSMVFGSKVYPPQEQTSEYFRKTGTIHLLVASGLHLSILMGSIMSLAGYFSLPKKASVTATVITGLLYVFMTGVGASIVRAFIMASMSLIAIFLDRENDSFSGLCFAALILLIINPGNIFKIGFQLSFFATFALLYAAPKILECLPQSIPKIIRSTFSVSFAAYIFTIPIILFNFSSLSVFAVLVNMLIVPWVGYLIILGFFTIFIGAIFLPFAKLFSGALFVMLFLLNFITIFFAKLPFAAINIKQISFPVFIGYYFLLVFFISKFRRNFLIGLLLLGSIFVWHFALIPIDLIHGQTLEIVVIDVGQGDSIFIKTPSGKTMLIDGGSSYAGKMKVLPFLQKYGLNQIDIVVLTHAHSDHVAGLCSVLENIAVNQVFDSGQDHNSSYYKRFKTLAGKTRLKCLTAGDIINFSDGVVANVLWPADVQLRGLNNNSIVIKMDYLNFSIYLAGDLEVEGEIEVARNVKNLNCEILKVGHHGSSTSTGSNFLALVNPYVSVISVGEKNSFGHPSDSVLERLKSFGSKIFRTDKNGTIKIKTDGNKFIVTSTKS